MHSEYGTTKCIKCGHVFPLDAPLPKCFRYLCPKHDGVQLHVIQEQVPEPCFEEELAPPGHRDHIPADMGAERQTSTRV